MVQFTITLAEIPIGVEVFFQSTMDFCKDYLSDSEPLFNVKIEKQDLIDEINRSYQNDIREGRTPVNYSAEYIETLALYRKIAETMPQHNVFLMHGASICVDGKGYMFTAKSGVGKTTHMNFWLDEFGDRAYVINGDKPLIKITDAGVFVCGTPWQGKENLGRNTIVKLNSLSVLTRAETDGEIEISDEDIFITLYGQVYKPHNSAMVAKTMKLINSFTDEIKIIKFGCTLSEKSAIISFEAMNKN